MSLPSWERGLKSGLPVMDGTGHLPSLPSWERGLKYYKNKIVHNIIWSLPSWERGLKLHRIFMYEQLGRVAPFMGAWIEIAKM